MPPKQHSGAAASSAAAASSDSKLQTVSEFLVKHAQIQEKEPNLVTAFSPKIGSVKGNSSKQFHTHEIQYEGKQIKLQASGVSMLPISPNIADLVNPTSKTHQLAAGCVSSDKNIKEVVRLGLSNEAEFRKLIINFSNQEDAFQSTPLMLLIRNGDFKIAKEILEGFTRFPNVSGKEFLNQQDRAGNTALHYAAALGRAEIVRELLSNGANPHIKNKNEKTPQELASEITKDEVKKILIDLEVHPERDSKVIFNAIQNNFILSLNEIGRTQEKILGTTPRIKIDRIDSLFFVLTNKDLLDEFSKCSDFDSLYNKTFHSFIRTMVATLSGVSILDACFKGKDAVLDTFKDFRPKFFIPAEGFESIRSQLAIADSDIEKTEDGKYYAVRLESSDSLSKEVRGTFVMKQSFDISKLSKSQLDEIKRLPFITVELGTEKYPAKAIFTYPTALDYKKALDEITAPTPSQIVSPNGAAAAAKSGAAASTGVAP